MSKQKNIKQIYADALFWAMSPKSKDKPYHITRTQESILRKLIHYDFKNPKITYSNELIGQHTFIESSTIEKVIPALTKMQYIKTITFQINDGSGKITSRRTININWGFIQEVLAEVPILNVEETNKNEGKNDNIEVNSSQPIIEPIKLNQQIVYTTIQDEDELTLGFQPNLSVTNPAKTIELEAKLVNGILHVPSDLLNFGISTRLKVHEAIEKEPSVNYTQGLIFLDDCTSYAAELLKIHDETNPQAIYMTKNYIETGVPS
jgi:hypothetical protein